MSLGQMKRSYEQTKPDPRMNKKARRTGIKILGGVGDINEVKVLVREEAKSPRKNERNIFSTYIAMERK